MHNDDDWHPHVSSEERDVTPRARQPGQWQSYTSGGAAVTYGVGVRLGLSQSRPGLGFQVLSSH